MILGLVGTLGAGKGTVVQYLTSKGFAHYSASGYLKETLLARGIAPNRDSYSALAGDIRSANEAGLAKILYERCLVDGAQNAVLESLHDVGEAVFIKEIGGVLLGVDSDMEVRYERAVLRGSEKDHVTFEEFKTHMQREEEGVGPHNIRKALVLADHMIMNNGTIDELHNAVDQWLAKLQ